MSYNENEIPKISLLKNSQIQEIYSEALKVLEEGGVYLEDKEACEILQKKGAINKGGQILTISKDLVEESLKVTPDKLTLYNREGEATVFLEGDNSYFNTGGAAIEQMESDGLTTRPTTAKDLAIMARLVEGLDNIGLQSTALVPSDIPTEISDSYRVYILLKNSTKPMLAGAFSPVGIKNIHELLSAAVGGREELAQRPRAVIDICPSAPLKWANLACQNIIDCAKLNLPIEYISVPMPGACAPATLAGSIVLHTAELLSGIVLAQAVKKGTPIIYGGAPMYFDMKTMNTCLSALEAAMIVIGYAQIGKFLNLPTHAYGLLSDAKTSDFQAGLEDALSGLLVALGGINIISGAGMLEFARITSLEKIAMDNDVAGQILRLKRGIEVNPETTASDLIIATGPGGNFMGTKHTLKWFRKESYLNSEIIDRETPKTTVTRSISGIQKRAKSVVQKILNEQKSVSDFKNRASLDECMRNIMKRYNISSLPEFTD